MIRNGHLALCVLVSLLLFTKCKKDDTKPMPIAKFEVVSVGENYNVKFGNLSENGESYEWDFGDNLTSSEQSPEHIFKKKGTFTVKLTVSNSSGDDTYTEELILESREKASVHLNESFELTNAGFNISWTTQAGRQGSTYETYFQISDKANFSSYPEVYEALSINALVSDEFKLNNTSSILWFRNLVPNKQYFFRVKLAYTYNGVTEDFFSDTKNITTKDMPIPELELTEFVNSKTFYTVKTSLTNFEGFFTNSPENKLEFAFDEEFIKTYTPESNNILDSYYKEPNETIYVKSTYTYNGVSKSIIKSLSIPEIFTDGNGWKGDNAVAFDYNGMKYFGIGDKNGKRVVFQISDFNGVGEYLLEGSPDNTLEDTYAYYYNGIVDKKYTLIHLQNEPLSLYIYKETDGEYYGRIGSSTDSHTYMSFRADDGSNESVYGMIFKATKQNTPNAISKEMSDILGKYRGNFNIYNNLNVEIKYVNKDTVTINQPMDINTDVTFPIYANVRFNDVDNEPSFYIPKQYIKELDSYIVGNKIPILGNLFNDPRNGRIDKDGKLSYSIIKDNIDDPSIIEDSNIFLGGTKID